jgi:hypothetical protein
MPCPKCGKRDRCSVRSEPPALVVCYRSPSDEHSADGGYIHREGAFERPTNGSAPSEPSVVRASEDVLDRAYRALLSCAPLSKEHRAALRARGLSDEHIERAGYATLEPRGRAPLAKAMVEAVGEHAAHVPGYVLRSDGARSWPSIAGWPGLLVPCRDARGRILGLQVRRDAPGDGPRYVWLSSRSSGGASAATFAHVPIIRPDARRDEVIVTEGPLKADVVTALDGRLCIAVPGVSAWSRALDALAAVGPSSVLVAFDADRATNPAVAAAHRSLCRALVLRSIRATSLRWNPSLGKGLDDALLAASRSNNVSTRSVP